MHRNTLLFVAILAVIAALVVGVNIGRRFSGQATNTPDASVGDNQQSPTPPTSNTYTNDVCAISLIYPQNFAKLESASGSAFINPDDASESFLLACQKDIPRPALRSEKIEKLIIYDADKTASVTANLYHDASAKDGTPIDKLIFRHPATGLDVFLTGLGATFNQIIATLKLLQ